MATTIPIAAGATVAMLRPAEPPVGERPIGELVHQLVEDGKAYARAEAEVAKAMASDKVAAYKLPAILLFTALLVLQAAINALAFGICLWLLPMIGPILAGLVGFLIFAAGAGLPAWVAMRKIKEAA